MLVSCGGAWAGAAASAALLALFWQQAGWLAHDFLHHQVFGARRLNNAAGYLLGNFFQARPAAVPVCWGQVSTQVSSLRWIRIRGVHRTLLSIREPISWSLCNRACNTLQVRSNLSYYYHMDSILPYA